MSSNAQIRQQWAESTVDVHTPQICITEIKNYQKVSSYAQIWPQGAEKQLSKVNVVVGGGGMRANTDAVIEMKLESLVNNKDNKVKGWKPFLLKQNCQRKTVCQQGFILRF